MAGEKVVGEDDLGLDEIGTTGGGVGDEELLDGGDGGDGDAGAAQDGGAAKADGGDDGLVIEIVQPGAEAGAAAADGGDAGDTGSDAGDGGDAGGDEDFDAAALRKQGLSDSMVKRLARENRIKRELRADAEAERVQRIKLEQTNLRLEKGLVSIGKETVADKLKSRAADLKKAKEDGDTDKEIEIQGEIATLQRRLEELNAAEEQIKVREAAGPATLNVEVQRWKGRNQWYGAKGFEVETTVARAIDAQVAKDGFRKDSPEYFRELDKRVRQHIPQLAARLKAAGLPGGGAPAEGSRRPHQPVAPAARERQPVSRDQGGKRRVRLEASDLENMRNFGLDPQNREHLRQYALQKLNPQ